jgi:signal peptidase I
MSMKKILLVVLIFVAGFISAYLWQYFSFNNGITGNVVEMPSDFVNDKEILVYPDRIVIKLNGAQVSNYDSTGSMMPILGNGANGIVINVSSPDEIKVGDIITYNQGEDLIVHRVVEKGVDSEGVYFITKGDSNGFSDGKIRFEQIEHKLVGILY